MRKVFLDTPKSSPDILTLTNTNSYGCRCITISRTVITLPDNVNATTDTVVTMAYRVNTQKWDKSIGNTEEGL